MNAPPPLHSPSEEESILIHGANRLATTLFALGLALRSARSFAWADCASSSSDEGDPSRTVLESHSGGPVVGVVEPSLLRPPNLDLSGLRRLLVLRNGPDEVALQNHLAMPELFQKLAAHASSADGRGVILLANVDLLAPSARSISVETPAIHQTLHQEGVTVIITTRTLPTEGMSRPFDRVYRIDLSRENSWADAVLTVEKGPGADTIPPPISLHLAWDKMGLDPDLLSTGAGSH